MPSIRIRRLKFGATKLKIVELLFQTGNTLRQRVLLRRGIMLSSNATKTLYRCPINYFNLAT
jgi:hypothetical protein